MAWPTAPGQIAAPLAGFCWRRHLELAHVKCSHPSQSLWPDLEMCCARGADISSEGEKKDTKRATSCEVALSKRLGLGESEFELQIFDFNVFKQLIVYVCGTIDGTDGKTTPS
ncbi:hypothetical protein [Aeromonas caviae]|uniref:hypothetical protein n=1 Tax=Aeromonas caviae TaxID=648 RepID=UPI002256EFD1|nr:hypothetical protein [Aeromonas caviae]MCX4071134.1 hypothetical protein [Aeromonas caviae]